MNSQPANLPNLLKPDFVDVAGLQLAAKLAELRSQGAHVAGMVAVEAGLWRLRLEWNDPYQGETINQKEQ